MYGINLLLKGNAHLFCKEIDCGESIPKLGGSICLTGFSGDFGNVGALASFTCENNDIEELIGYNNLSVLKIGNNKLSGQAPIMNSNTLRIYKINNNYYSGSLPTIPNNFLLLEVFAVQDQQGALKFNGTINQQTLPPSLKYYNVGNNRLIGELPNISNITGLLYFIANNNFFWKPPTGLFPPLLTYYDISSNDINNQIDINTSLQFYRFVGNTGDACLLNGRSNAVPTSGVLNPDYRLLTGSGVTVCINI